MVINVNFSPGCSISHCCRSGTVKGHYHHWDNSYENYVKKFDINGKYTVSNPQNRFDISFEMKDWEKKKRRYKATLPFNSREMSGVYSLNGKNGGEFKLSH